MSETAPAAAPAAAAPAPAAKAPAKKAKKAAGGAKAKKPLGPSVTELITQAVAASKERKGVSLAALKKVLAAGGYDVEKNNSRIKLGLRGLVDKGMKDVVRRTRMPEPAKSAPAPKKGSKKAVTKTQKKGDKKRKRSRRRW
ncbi:histone H1.11R-like [Alligator sinensis]|uniref:Histone H1.11R-like n=1 Tax=Alligator sinensis TaxID=38654 RepID=A0A3Q0GQX3_ALLSI|nr:histone H1.11R-like [Alligator sinensis]